MTPIATDSLLMREIIICVWFILKAVVLASGVLWRLYNVGLLISRLRCVQVFGTCLFLCLYFKRVQLELSDATWCYTCICCSNICERLRKMREIFLVHTTLLNQFWLVDLFFIFAHNIHVITAEDPGQGVPGARPKGPGLRGQAKGSMSAHLH